jgi:16S rRNA processing protein RimM
MTADILLGVVTGAQGLSGDVRVKTFTETPERIGAYGPLRTAEGRRLEITSTRQAKGDTIVVRFKGISDRTAAEALADTKLFVSRDALPATETEEFYHTDLVGLRAQDHEGRVIGDVRAVHNFGAGDVVEIQRIDGGTLLIPFTRDFVPHIHLADKYVVVAEPVDLEAEEERGVE